MTFKKLLKEAAKVDPSTFKLGPKVKTKAQPSKAKTGDLQTSSGAGSAKGGSSRGLILSKLDRSSSNTSGSLSPQKVTQRPTSKSADMGMSSNMRRLSPSRTVPSVKSLTTGSCSFLRSFSS